MGLVVLGVLEQDFVHVGRGVLVEPVGAAEDDQSDLAVAQHRQLIGLFHDAEFALIERHLLMGNVRWAKMKKRKKKTEEHKRG